MQKRVFIIHGHQGNPDEGWLPWMRAELVRRGFIVTVPPMPDPEWPGKRQWMSFLRDIVGHCDEHTYFVGHSLGCQAILRYLQYELPAVRVGGAVFVAGFEHLSTEFYSHKQAAFQLREWLTDPIHWEAIRGKSRNFVALFSDNDSWVPLDNVKVFDEKLYAQTRILHNRKHFSGEEGITELPEALDALLEMAS